MDSNIRDIEDQVLIYEGPNSPSDRSITAQESIVEQPENNNDEEEHGLTLVNENSTVLRNFPYTLLMKVSASEPRDVLQSERTCLTFVRLACSLFFTSLGIMLNFKLDTSGEKHKDNPSNVYSTATSYVLLVLGAAALVICGVDYFVTIDRYANHKIYTYNFNNLSTVLCMTCIIITLMGISISLIVEEYLASA